MKVILKEGGEYLGLDKDGKAVITPHKQLAHVIDTDTDEGAEASFQAFQKGVTLEIVHD